jgi:branched-chain amino acid transport system permease protein
MMNSKTPLWILGLLLIAALFTVPLYTPRFIQQLLLTVILNVELVTAWNILSGFTGYLFLGVAAMYGLAGYTFAIVSGTVPYALAIPLVGLITFVVAYLIGMLFLRIRGPYFTIATYALVLLFANVILYYEQAFSKTTGRYVSILPISTIYLVLLGVTLVTLVVAFLIKKSRFGYGLACIRGNEDLANIIGINASRYKCLAFGICAFFVGIAAATVLPRGGYIDTTIVFAPSISFNILAMGIIGGLGSLRGGILSAVAISLLFELLGSGQNPYPFFISLGVVLVLVIFFFPRGIEGIIQRVTGMGKKTRAPSQT